MLYVQFVSGIWVAILCSQITCTLHCGVVSTLSCAPHCWFGSYGVWLLQQREQFDACSVVKRKPIKTLKIKCVFTESLKAEYPFLKEDQQMGNVFCTICKSLNFIEHRGLLIVCHNQKK
jgi:hypothetical protein